MNENTFTLTFKTPEMLCAATALGITSLPLLTGVNSQPTDSALQEEIRNGYDSLQARGLIRAISPTQWQVDNLLTILVHWLAAPDYLVRLDDWKNSGLRREASLFFLQGQAFWLQSVANEHQFILFKEADDWLKYSESWIGPLVESADNSIVSLPMVNLSTFLPQVQQDITSMEPMLQRAGLSQTTARQTLETLAMVDQAVTMTWLDGAFKTINQTILLCTPTGTWGGDVQETDELILLRPFSADDLSHMLNYKVSHFR